MKHHTQKERYIFGSLTRTSDLSTLPFTVCPLERSDWETGDFVVGRSIRRDDITRNERDWVELPDGRRRCLMPNDLLVGALGVRRATKEAVGTWHRIGSDFHMQDLCSSGLFGVETSHSPQQCAHPTFLYEGHATRNGQKVRMNDFMPKHDASNGSPYSCPTVLVLGTSMSVGKTTVARAIIHLLKEMGVRRVVGAKLTGAGSYHDVLSMLDAGADAAYDFVDVGLPSTVLPEHEYQPALKTLLGLVSVQCADVVVAEVGASPCEYNGTVALREVAKTAKFVVLCASDHCAVKGVDQYLKDMGLDIQPDVVSGIATATSAGCDLVRELTGIHAMGLFTTDTMYEWQAHLAKALSL